MKSKGFKITIIGGGSTWTPGLLKSLCVKKNRLPLRELVLYDIDQLRQEPLGEFAKILFREENPDVLVRYNISKEEAYKDADFIFCQIRTGGFKMRELDEKIPLRHNVLGQETCGPGGFAYGMRSITDMIEIVNDVRKYAKDAWILNYTNPAAIVAVALKRAFPNDEKILNICDQPINLLKSYGRLINKDYHDFDPVYFGLNHFGWFKNLYNKEGIDLVPEIKKVILNEGFYPADKEERDKSWLDTYAMVKDMLECFPEYLPNTYLQYYLFPEYKTSHLDKNYTRTNEVIDGREKKVFTECKNVIQKNTAKNSPIAINEAHADMIVDLAIAIVYNTNDKFIMIVENNGCISNINNDAMIEVTSLVGSNGPRSLNVGEVSTFYKGLIENQYAYEKLTCDAYFEKSYDKALQALTLNRTVVDGFKAKKILDELIIANKGYWPDLK